MPNSLRSKLSSLRYKGKITEEEYKDLISKLDGHDKALRTPWIPCSEKLPEPWTSVLITFSGEYGSLTADHAVGTGSYDGLNGWFIDEIQGYTEWLTVSAWMELPEPYKGGEKE